MKSSIPPRSPVDIELQDVDSNPRAAIFDDPLASLPVLERSGLRSMRNVNVEIVVEPTQERTLETDDSNKRKVRKTELVQMTALCWTMFLVGWNDGATGPLLPRIQEVYHVSLAHNLLFLNLRKTDN
jgi:hypothetical protein